MNKLLVFLVALFSNLVFCQQNELKDKPKIGLVLSGGGAKGLAHIGVLKVLEEAGVKVDYVAGTSMGAIVGGLYASGYNATQIDSIFRKINFDDLIREKIPRTSKNFYEKRNDQVYAVVLPFDGFKVKAPAAYSKGVNIYNLLTKLTHQSRYIDDFNQLKIPFLCIATDIETGKQVVLNKGVLPTAMLASAAFPSLFYPVKINDQVLIDGGVSNNYPIDELRKMGADLIIGVDVQDDLKERKDLVDATKILVQISNMQMIEKMIDKRKNTNIYIKPDISGFNVVSFQAGEDIVKRGEEAGYKVLDELKKIGSSNFKPLSNAGINDSLCVAKIQINELKNYTRAYVIGKLGFKQGESISYEDLSDGVNNLNATQNFKSIQYSFENHEGNESIQFKLTENETRTLLKTGIHFDNLYKTAILFNVSRKKVLFKNDVISADVALGDHFRYYLDYYIDNGFYWSLGFKSRYNSFNRNVKLQGGDFRLFEGVQNKTVNVDYSDFSSKVYLQTILKQKFIAGGELEYKDIKATSSTLEANKTTIQSSNFLMFNLYLNYDSLDDFYFPTNGYFLNVNYQTHLYSTSKASEFNKFSYFKVDNVLAKSLTKNLTLQMQAEGGFSIGKGRFPFYDFMLGGFGFHKINNFGHFYGYDFLSLNGNSFVKVRATLDWQFIKKNHLNFSANYANIGDNIFDTGDWFKSPPYSGYAIGYAMQTLIGPVQVKHSWSPETSDHYTWFSIGYWF